MASSWESWVRIRGRWFAPTLTVGNVRGVLARAGEAFEFGRASLRRVCRCERLVTILRRESRFFETETWGSKTRTDLPPDSRCRPHLRHLTASSPALQTRPREGMFDAGLELRIFATPTAFDVLHARLPSWDQRIRRNQAGTLGPGSFVLAWQDHLVAIDDELRETLGRFRWPKPCERHLCHQLETYEHSRIRFLTSKTWRGFVRPACTMCNRGTPRTPMTSSENVVIDLGDHEVDASSDRLRWGSCGRDLLGLRRSPAKSIASTSPNAFVGHARNRLP